MDDAGVWCIVARQGKRLRWHQASADHSYEEHASAAKLYNEMNGFTNSSNICSSSERL